MKKRICIWGIFVLACFFCMSGAFLENAYASTAISNHYFEKTKKIVVKKKGYLKVTSSLNASHALYKGKISKAKQAQIANGNKVYFAVNKGTYYIKSSMFLKFRVRYSLKEAKPCHYSNTTMETALKLTSGKGRMTISYEEDKNRSNLRYFKFVPQKDSHVVISTGELLDQTGKELPVIWQSHIMPVYLDYSSASSESNPKKIVINSEASTNMIGIGNWANKAYSVDELKAGETYYIRVTMQSATVCLSNGKSKVTKNCVTPVSWDYDTSTVPLPIVY